MTAGRASGTLEPSETSIGNHDEHLKAYVIILRAKQEGSARTRIVVNEDHSESAKKTNSEAGGEDSKKPAEATAATTHSNVVTAEQEEAARRRALKAIENLKSFVDLQLKLR